MNALQREFRALRQWVQHEPIQICDESVFQIRSERFKASWYLAAVACVVFSGAALISGNPRSLWTALAALGFLGISGYLYWKKDLVRTSARFMVQWGFVILFAASFNDGQSKSETLWMVGLLPMMASYLLSRRCWLNASLGAFTLITLVCVLHFFLEVPQEIREEPIDLIVYRLVILGAFSAVAMFATVTSHRQINELKRRDAELEKAQADSESEIQAKNRFLANMSHEIRTPMHGILGTTQLLLECGLSPGQKEQANVVAECGESLLRILNNILDISKIDAGKFKVSPRQFENQAWISDLQDTWAPIFNAQGIGLLVQDQTDHQQDWIADKDRLTQVIAHLFHNSLRFTKQGCVTWSLNVTSTPGGGHVLDMYIQDTGPGISRSDMERVFDVFERDVEADGLGAQGMGLGLTISRKILALMGAEIDLINPGDPAGACFRIQVPIGLAERKARDINPLSIIPVRNLHGLRVLVADDQELNLKIASAHLRQLGCEVVTVADGLQAVQAANQRPFDIILMDINMPELNGWQASRNIRQSSSHNRNTPILALTADDAISTHDLQTRGAMVDHLSKPFTRSALKTALARNARMDAR